MNNNVSRLPIMLFVFLLISGCCLKSVNLKPELNAIDLKAAKAGSASFDAKFEFKDCCPTDKQKELALKIQDAVQRDYEKLLKGEIPLDEFNNHIKAAKDAIESVILVCSAKAVAVKALEDREQKLKSAWDEVEKTLKTITKP